MAGRFAEREQDRAHVISNAKVTTHVARVLLKVNLAGPCPGRHLRLRDHLVQVGRNGTLRVVTLAES